MEKIGEAILSQVKVDAQQIIDEAEEKAGQEIEKARQQRQRNFEEQKLRAIKEAEAEATRILAQASIEARQELSRAKAEIIDEIISRAKSLLLEMSGNKSSLLSLLGEAIDGLGGDKARIYVSAKDVKTIQDSIKRDKELADRIVEVKKFDCWGGVVAESIDGKIRIDNTYDTRLEMLLPRILPEVSGQLFKGL